MVNQGIRILKMSPQFSRLCGAEYAFRCDSIRTLKEHYFKTNKKWVVCYAVAAFATEIEVKSDLLPARFGHFKQKTGLITLEDMFGEKIETKFIDSTPNLNYQNENWWEIEKTKIEDNIAVLGFIHPFSNQMVLNGMKYANLSLRKRQPHLYKQ